MIKLLPVVLLIVALAGADAWLRRLDVVAPEQASSATPPAPQPIAAAELHAGAGSTGAPSGLPLPDTLAWRRLAVAAELQRQDELYRQLYDRYRGDRLAFVRGLLPLARAGDSQAQRTIALVLDQCEVVASQASGPAPAYALSLPEGLANAPVDRDTASCEALMRASAREIGSGARWRRQAPESGNGRELIRDAEDGRNGKDASMRIAEFRNALAALDTRVLREIVDHADSQSGGRGDGQGDFGLAVAELAACKLGADCSGTGPSLEILCTIEDCRGIDSVQRLFELRLSPQAFVVANQRAQYFADRFLAGSDNWPEAQAYEQHLRQIAAQQSS